MIILWLVLLFYIVLVSVLIWKSLIPMQSWIWKYTKDYPGPVPLDKILLLTSDSVIDLYNQVNQFF